MSSSVIDKVRLLVSTDQESFCAVMEYINSTAGEINKKRYKYWKTKYTTKATMTFAGKNTLHICAGISNKKVYASFEFNPSKYSDQSWSELLCALECMLHNGYTTLHSTGRMRHIELATDFPGVSFSDVVILEPRLKPFNLSFEKKGSLYLGSKQSKKHFIAYDKAKEIIAKNGHCPHKHLLRIEARLGGQTRTLNQIGELKNPYSTLIIADRAKLMGQQPSDIWPDIGAAIQNGVGVQQAYVSLPLAKRHEIALSLADYRPDWWKPPEHWKACLANAEKMRPESVQQFT